MTLANPPLGIAALLLGASLTLGCAASAQERPKVEYFAREGSRAPFSPAVRVGDVLYLSGQIGARPDGTLPDSMEEQTRLAMENMRASLRLAGADTGDIFKCTVMLADMSEWAAFNKVYLSYFTPGRLPARSSFGTSALALDALVEIECLARAPREAGE